MLGLLELKNLVQQTLLSINARNALTRIVDGLCHESLDGFSGHNSSTLSNVTGDGTAYTVLFSVEDYDNQGSFVPATGIFTARTAGIYQFNATLFLMGIDVAHTTGELSFIAPTTYTYTFNPAALRTGANEASVSISAQMMLAVGDTVNLRLLVSGGAATIDIYGAAGSRNSYFSGRLIA